MSGGLPLVAVLYTMVVLFVAMPPLVGTFYLARRYGRS